MNQYFFYLNLNNQSLQKLKLNIRSSNVMLGKQFQFIEQLLIWTFKIRIF